MRIRARLIGAFSIALLLPLTTGNALGQIHYNVTDLGTLGGASSSAYAINNSGQVVGQAATSSGAKHAFLYSGGPMADLGTLGGADSCATSINNGGQVVGNADTGGFSPPPFSQPYSHAFFYNGGGLQDLGTLPDGSFSYAAGINDSGQIVGYANTSSTDPFCSHTFILSGGTMLDLGAFGENFSGVSAINAAGQLVGSYGPFSYTLANGTQMVSSHAFLYSGGTVQDLGTLAGAAFSYANAINSMGEIAGYADFENTSPNHYRAFLWRNGSMTDIGTLGWDNCIAHGLNDEGQVVGWLDTDGKQSAFFYDGGSMLDLNSLIPTFCGWQLLDATAINDLGQIVGHGTNPSGQDHAYLLTPNNVPEPSALALLGIGAVTLLCFGVLRDRR